MQNALIIALAATALMEWALLLRDMAIDNARNSDPRYWHRYPRYLPYRDVDGRLVLFPSATAERRHNGLSWEYREGEITEDDILDKYD